MASRERGGRAGTTARLCRSRVAAKNFCFRNFAKFERNFNFVFREIFLEIIKFRKIQKKIVKILCFSRNFDNGVLQPPYVEVKSGGGPGRRLCPIHPPFTIFSILSFIIL